MYTEHQPIIAAYAQAHPDNLARVLQFCILSARVQFPNVLADVELARDGDPGVLFGWKARAYAELWADRVEIAYQLGDIWSAPGLMRRQKTDYALRYLATHTGLGLIKGGFALQMAYGVSGCLDTVNKARLGLDPRLLRCARPTATARTRWRYACRYNALVYRLGGPRKLWDDWCRAITEKYPIQFPDAEAASAYHLDCIGVT